MFNQYPFYYSLSAPPYWFDNYFPFRHIQYYPSPPRPLYHVPPQFPQVVTTNGDCRSQAISAPEINKGPSPFTEHIVTSKNAKPESVDKELHPKSPYKMMNPGRWTNEEHERFLEGNLFAIPIAIRLYGKNWIKVEAYVGSRSRSQIRSHAQKYFNNEKKNAPMDLQKKDDSKPSTSNRYESKDLGKNDKGVRYTFLEEFM